MSGKELVFGLHAATHILDKNPERVLAAFLQKDRDDKRLGHIKNSLHLVGCHVTTLSSTQLDRLTEGGRHQGVVLEVRARSALSETDLMSLVQESGDATFLMILDSVQDPRNLGACMRVADGVGATAVVVPKNRAVGLTVVARKVASGAYVPFVQVTNLARTLKSLRNAGVWIVGTSDAADDDVYSSNLTGPIGVVMGGEEKGLRRLTRENCDALVSIPMRGRVSSLNVSVASGVVLYEALRQRKTP
ncbi:MAG: 23S rRNA (guanosine(2251)-2'-O)-methyltransferase RlmB [Pseudomonadota bacterium]